MNKEFYEKCKNRCKKLMDITIHLNQTYFTLMQLRDIQAEHNKAINISVTFYRTVIRNCIMTLFVETSKLYKVDNNEGTRNLLLKMKENALQLDLSRPIEANRFSNLDDSSAIVERYCDINELVNNALNRIDEVSSIIEHLHKQRNKIYAHYEINANFKKLFSDYEVTYNEFKTLILLNTNICNALYMYFFESTMNPLFIGHDDLKSTINFVEKGIKAKRGEL